MCDPQVERTQKSMCVDGMCWKMHEIQSGLGYSKGEEGQTAEKVHQALCTDFEL